MVIIYPFNFTRGGSGINWRLERNRLDVLLRYSDGSEVTTNNLTINHLTSSFIILDGPISGYFTDSLQQIRVTNLVGFDGTNLLKRCPSCGYDKSLVGFDYSGRYTDGRRDQSCCNECRGNYR